ncbi:MAG: hypothetical protein RPT95_10370 [Candidatus Sedimenticola sp. (ex Thyasira tokunagai)]
MLKNEIKNVALIIALVTAGLYTYGLAFYQGYLAYWGIEESLFIQNFERTLFHGFLASSHLGMRALVFLVVVFIGLFAVAAFFTWLSKKLKDNTWLQALFYEPAPSKEKIDVPKHLKNTGLLALVTYWGLLALLVLISLLEIAGNFGKNVAADQHRKFIAGETSPVTVKTTKDVVTIGMPIVCSTTHCAFFIEGGVKIMPLSTVTVIESKPSKA